MRRVLLNFQHYDDLWSVHFLEEDCKTSINRETRYYDFATEEALRAFVSRCNPEDMSAWSRGSLFVQLTDEQYAKLKTKKDHR